MTVSAISPGSGALQRTLRGFFLSAAAMDGGFFLIMTAMPFKVLHLGGGALELGLVPAIGAVTYIICAPLSGRWSDRVSRTALCLAGGITLIVCAALAAFTNQLPQLLALQVLMGLGKALYWPTVQATLGDLSPGASRVKALGRFNVSWSGGKTLGFLAGGLLLSCCGFQTTFLSGAGLVAVAFLLLPRGKLVAQAQTEATAIEDDDGPVQLNNETDQQRLRAFRTMGWVANTAAYGAIGILTHHLPQWFQSQAWDADRYGWFLGAILGSQTIFFLLLSGPLRLVYSTWRLWIPQALAVVAVALIPLMPGYAGLLLVAPIIGLACGVSYTASIFYSLEAPDDRGRNAGIHEGLVGAGGFLPPLAAGLLVRFGLPLASPYYLAALLLAVGLAIQMALPGARIQPCREHRT